MDLGLKKVFQIFLLFMTVTLLITGFLFLNRTVSPLSEADKHKALLKLLGRQVNLSEKTTPQGNLSYNGKYYSLMYPKAAEIYNPPDMANASAAGILEWFSFNIKQLPRAYFYSEVKEAPWYLSSVSDYSGIAFRLAKPDIYSKASITAGNQDGLVFEKQSLSNSEAYEKSGFFLVKGKIYSFTVQSVDERMEKSLFDKVMSTLRFLN
jgi:hypothetical protein